MTTKKIALGVTSSISIYKACEVLRAFQDKGIGVRVIMTRNATKLVSPRLFSALSGEPVVAELFTDEASPKIAHISLAEEVSLLLIAPATANIIGKLASGVADDFLSTFYLAVRCPVLIAPAMNEAMYLHPQTQANIQKLRAAGVEFILPEKGHLACGEEGWGRLASPQAIVGCGLALLDQSDRLKGKTFLITAGPTREPLDPVRFLSNRSSGKMGYELAAEALRRGADVILVSGPTGLIPPPKAEFKPTPTAAEMAGEVKKNFGRADVVVMAAAVSDFRFAEILPQKVKKSKKAPRVDLVPTEDILESLSRQRGRKDKIVVGFAAETENVLENARKKVREKSLDLIAANDVSREGIGFDAEMNEVFLIDNHGRVTETGRRSKREISRLIIDRIEVLLGQRK